MPGGNCAFNQQWLRKPEYAKWIREEKETKYSCFCCLCKKKIDLRVMGESALKSHAKGKKHIELLKASEPAVPMSCFLKSAKTSSAVAASTDSSVSSPQQLNLTEQTGSVPRVKMTDFCTKTDTLKAEILWTLKIVNAHNSFRSCEDSVFASMFPDSAIARNFKCGETKSRYLATFGIAPYFSEALKKRVKDEDTYVLLFDESLNKELKLKKLDIHVRYWNTVENEICTEYLTSKFLGHACAADICDSLQPTLTDLTYKKLLQISMDGPSVNWKVRQYFVESIYHVIF